MNLKVLLAALLFGCAACSTNADTPFGIPYEKAPAEGLVVGGQPTKAQLKAVADAGFTTVVNLRREGEFDDFDEAAEVKRLGMNYVHIPVRNIEAITPADAKTLDEAIAASEGPVLLHCTVGWRAGGLYAISRHLFHGVSDRETLEIAAAAHMDHATGDVEEWLDDND